MDATLRNSILGQSLQELRVVRCDFAALYSIEIERVVVGLSFISVAIGIWCHTGFRL